MIGLEPLSPDSSATILLCSSLGLPQGTVRPVSPVAFARLKDLLRRQSFSGVHDLTDLSAADIVRSLGVESEEAERYVRLLSRAGQLAFELDRLQSRGVWVVTVADQAYPDRLRDRLGDGAPPVLFGSGDPGSLLRGGVAIVGSRDADEGAVAFTEALAEAVARGGSSVVSGGARGIDVAAMRAAFRVGGSVIGVVPEGVERRIRESATRAAVASGQAVIVSPYHPMAPFSAVAAMGRNKLIYALSDVAVVVASAEGSGGTWTGAVEALKHGWVPVAVRSDAGVPAGNLALLSKGAWPIGTAAIGERLSVAELLAMVPARVGVREAGAAYDQPGLFDPES